MKSDSTISILVYIYIYDMIWYDMIWYDMIWNTVLLHHIGEHGPAASPPRGLRRGGHALRHLLRGATSNSTLAATTTTTATITTTNNNDKNDNTNTDNDDNSNK